MPTKIELTTEERSVMILMWNRRYEHMGEMHQPAFRFYPASDEEQTALKLYQKGLVTNAQGGRWIISSFGHKYMESHREKSSD